MGILHADLEGKIQEEYGLKEVVRRPLKSAWSEIFQDLNYEELFSGSKKRKSRLNDLAILASFGISAVPHELIHARTNILTGGTNEQIVINRLYGGDLAHLVYSGIDAKLLLPILGGYVKFQEYGSVLGELATCVAPFVMTPLGIYMVSEGKKRKSLPLAIVGSGMIIAQAGGIIGDFFHFGKTVMYETADFVANTVGYQNFDADDSWMALPLAVGGFYLGSKALSFSYRLSKSGVNYCKNLFKKKEK